MGSSPEEELEVGPISSTSPVPTETAVAGLTEFLPFGSTTGPPECTSDLVTENLVTTVSTHQTISHGTESLTSELELTEKDFASGSGVPLDMADVSVTVLPDGEVEPTSTFPILGMLKPVFKCPTFGTKTSTVRLPTDGDTNTPGLTDTDTSTSPNSTTRRLAKPPNPKERTADPSNTDGTK